MILLVNEIRINLINGLTLARKSFQYKKRPRFYSTNEKYEKNVIVKYRNFFYSLSQWQCIICWKFRWHSAIQGRRLHSQSATIFVGGVVTATRRNTM